MSKETMIRIGSVAMIIAGLLWPVAFVGVTNEIGYSWLLWCAALVVLAIGLLGLYAYASLKASRDVRVWSILAIAAVGLTILGQVGSMDMATSDVNYASPFFLLFLLSLTGLLTLLLVMGIPLHFERVLPRWGGRPLLLVLPLEVFMIGAVFCHADMGQAPGWLTLGVFITSGLGLVLLGVAMLPPRIPAPIPA